MAAQGACPEVKNIFSLLSETDQWTELDTAQKASSTLEAINDFFSSSPAADEGLQVARLAFGSILSHIQVDNNAFSLFDATFSFLKLSFDDFLQECEGSEPRDANSINKLLQHCCVVCECCDLALQFLLQAEKIAVEDLGSLPHVFLHIVTSSLAHCKQSEAIYCSQLDQVQEYLSRLFQLSVEVAVDFGNFLSKLTFDSFSEDDLQILVAVCDQLCTTAASLSQLSEVRGSVIVWRAYANLVQHYHGALVTRLDLSSPLAALVKEIKDGFDSLAALSVENNAMSEKDKKIVQRIIKMTSFCLKVVIALCEKFRGYMRGAHATLVLLILVLYRFSPHNVMLSGYPNEVKKDIEHQVMIGSEPLLMHLRDDEDFVKAVMEEGEKEASSVGDWSSYLLLLVAVLRPHSNTTTLHVNALVAKVFENIEKSHASLSFPCLMDGVMCRGKPQTTVTLYEHILTRLCAVVATFDAHEFSLLERDLVCWLLSGRTWPAFLAADVWCFIARYGTSELCRSQCVFLLEVLSKTHTSPPSHQHLVTAALLSRLIGKLSPSHKEDIIMKINTAREKGNYAGTWFRLVRDEMEDELKMMASLSFIENCSKHMNRVTSRSATEQDIMVLMDDLQGAAPLLSAYIRTCSAEDPLITSFITALVQLWTRIPLDYVRCSLVEELICGLLETSTAIIGCVSSLQLLQVLSQVKECCLRGSAVVKINICDLISTAGHCHLPHSPHLHIILTLMSDILSEMMKDPNPIVHQFAVDAFVAVGKHTLHEKVLSMSLGSCGEEVREQVTLYLQQKPFPTSHNFLSLLQHQSVIGVQKENIQNETRLIANHILSESLQKCKDESTSVCHSHEQLNSAKRRREGNSHPDEEASDVNVLLDSLKQAHNLMKKIKTSAVIIDAKVSSEVKGLVENMASVWDAYS